MQTPGHKYDIEKADIIVVPRVLAAKIYEDKNI
jgi:hypothetical protein